MSPNDLPLTAELMPGAALENGPVINQQVVAYFSAQKIKPATVNNSIPVKAGGIGSMRIGSLLIKSTFKVK